MMFMYYVFSPAWKELMRKAREDATVIEEIKYE